MTHAPQPARRHAATPCGRGVGAVARARRLRAAAPLRTALLCAARLCLLACVLTGPVARANLLPEFHLFSDPPPPVPLALGSVLFHFYQEDHRATLAEALYVESRLARDGQPLPGRDQLLLAKGSAALGLGMLVQARAWLLEVDATALPETALPRLHLALARVAFLDGDDARARDYLQRLPEDFAARADVHYLRAELARRAGALDEMASALDGLEDDDPLWFFGWHNHAVAARAAGDVPRALAAFDRIAETRPEASEAADVAVRAGLQGALLRAESGDLDAAVARLDRVPVAGLYGRMALAQRAQLALAGGDVAVAAKVFEALAAPVDGRWDSERVDALIGTAYIREQTLGGPASLPAYERAAAQLDARVGGLRALGGTLADRSWLAMLVDVEASARDTGIAGASARRDDEDDEDEAGDEDEADDEADSAVEAARLAASRDGFRAIDARLSGVDWLAWLAAGETQRDLLGWRRLGDSRARLAVLGDSAFALGQAADEQERRVARVAERLGANAIPARMDALEAHLRAEGDQLRGLLTSPLGRGDDAWPGRRALATEDELRALDRLDRLERLARDRADGAALRRIARLRGVLAYGIDSEVAARVWSREKQRRSNLARLEALDLRGTRIDQAERERAGQRGAGQRVAALRARLAALHARMGELRQAREERLTAGLRQRIEADLQDSERQLTFARLAMARIADAELTAAHAAEPAR
jgi:hypothetical protein